YYICKAHTSKLYTLSLHDALPIYEHAYGDQCEKCGTSLSPTDLINPKSKLSGNVPVLKETKHWFLDLARYTDFLKKWILVDHKDDWKNNVLGQCRSWLEAGDGLQSRSM